MFALVNCVTDPSTLWCSRHWKVIEPASVTVGWNVNSAPCWTVPDLTVPSETCCHFVDPTVVKAGNRIIEDHRRGDSGEPCFRERK
jgi:hypothetical protein